MIDSRRFIGHSGIRGWLLEGTDFYSLFFDEILCNDHPQKHQSSEIVVYHILLFGRPVRR